MNSVALYRGKFSAQSNSYTKKSIKNALSNSLYNIYTKVDLRIKANSLEVLCHNPILNIDHPIQVT